MNTDRPVRILVVDDSPELLGGAARLLRGAGFVVLEAGAGAEGLLLARQEKPDLILLDVCLPHEDGIEVCRQLKRQADTESTFIVLCSAQRAGPEEVARGYEAGGDGYIARPLCNRELLARVQGFVRHKRALDRLRASEQLYRAQFETNPQPLLIVSADTRTILATNAAAARLYGFAPEELPGMELARLFANAADSSGVAGSTAAPTVAEHRRKDGATLPVELIAQRLDWEGASALALMVKDITDRVELATERRRQQASFDGELRSLAQQSEAGGVGVTSRALGLAPLSEAAPEHFAALLAEYERGLTDALERQAFRAEHPLSALLRRMAERLCFLRAGPRDVTELHYRALKKRMDQCPARARGLLEAGRITLLELMGLLVAAYRNHSPTAAQAPQTTKLDLL